MRRFPWNYLLFAMVVSPILIVFTIEVGIGFILWLGSVSIALWVFVTALEKSVDRVLEDEEK